MKRNRSGLRKQIISIICVLISVMSIILMGISYRAFYHTYTNFYYDKALGIVKMLANEVDGDRIAHYVETGETDEAYEILRKRFDNAKANTSGLSYLYIAVPYEDHFVYVLEASTDQDNPDNISKLGDVFEYGETEYIYLLPDIQAKSASTQIVYGADVGFGKSISVWAPVFDKDGNVAAVVEGDYVLTSIEKEINFYVCRVFLFLVAALILITFIMIRVINTGVVTPILKLTDYVNSYQKSGSTPEPVKCKNENEIKWLADAFDNMIVRIGKYVEDIRSITAEKERIGAELNVATQIQADMLPSIFPPFPDKTEFDIYATMTPAKEVGGDFYDFFLLDENHLALVMADVSGKGVPAALFMVIAKTLIKNRAQMGGSPAEILGFVNDQLCEGNEADMFVTVWLGILDLTTGKGMAANAGHEKPAIRRAGQNYEFVRTKHSPAVAVMEGMKFREHEFELHPGDSLYIYTDGVAEATNAQNALFGDERMMEALNSNPDASPKELLQNIQQAIDEFVGDAPQFDDITMLCLKYKGTGSEGEI